MAIKQVIEIEVEAGSAKTNLKDIGAVIQEQKDITIEFEKELRNLEAQLANTSSSNMGKQKVLKTRVTDLKDALKDQRLSLKELNNERGKATKVTEINTKSLSQNYGVVQLLDQVTGGLASQVRSVVDANRLFNFSLKGTRTALIATGIGAFVVALGLMAAYWDEIVEFVTKANEKLARQNELLQEGIDLTELKLDNLRLESGILKEHGASLDNNIKKQTALLNRQLGSALALAQSKKELLEIEKIEAQRELRASRAAGRRNKRLKSATQTEFDEETKEKIKALTEAALAADKQVLKLTKSIIDLLKPEEQEEEKEVKDNKVGREKVEGVLEGFDAIVEEPKDATENVKFLELTNLNDLLLVSAMNYEHELTKIEQDGANARVALSKAENAAKAEIASINLKTFSEGVNFIASLDKKSKALQASSLIATNAAGIATNIIDTNASNARLTLEGGITAPALITANFVRMGIGIASSIAATAKGLSALGGSGGGARGGSAGGSAPRAPAFNLVKGSASNQIAESIQGQNKPIKAYVIGSDVTTSQSLDRQIEGDSTL